MEHVAAFRKRFALKEFNNLNNPLHAAIYQDTVIEFMQFVRDNEFKGTTGQALMRDFLAYVNNEKVWHLAEMVVPEFRETLEEQYEPSMPSHSLCVMSHKMSIL